MAVAAAMLAAAALFHPLRRRVELRVGRRLSRARYNAGQAVAAFAAQLKDAVDLDSVRLSPCSGSAFRARRTQNDDARL